MKILVIFVILTICSTTLSQRTDGRKPKRKVKTEPPVRGYYEFPGTHTGPLSEGHPGIRTKLSIPYVGEGTSANRVIMEYPGHRYKEVNKGRHVEVDQQGHFIGIDQQGLRTGIDQQSRYVGHDQQGHPGGVDHQSRHVGVHQQGLHVEVHQQGPYVGHDQHGRHDGVDQQGRHVGVDQQGRHAGHDKHGHHSGVGQHGRNVGRDQGHNVGQQGLTVGVKKESRHADEKHRGRQTRQSLNTFLTSQVNPSGSFLGGTQGSSGFQQDTLSPFPGGSHAENRPGNQGSFVIPVFLGPGGSGGNHGGSGGFRPDPSGFIGLNGNFPFIPQNPPSGTSSTGGPGGLSSSPDSGLAGGLGGVYGAGYGFGLGGLIFGGPNGPVFAGNAALSEGFGESPESAVSNDEFGDPDKPNAVQTPRITAFRPVPSRVNSFGAGKAKANSQSDRSVTGMNTKSQHPNGRTPSPTSNGGETVGYVAFIFPKRHFQRQNPKALQSSSHSSIFKSATDSFTFNTKLEAAPVTNRPAPTLLPVPVHIPIDRPYPVLVPKPYPVEVLKPYPVAVPIREAVPYEVTRPIPVPVAVSAQVTRPAESPFLAGVNGVQSVVLQPSLETSILKKRSD